MKNRIYCLAAGILACLFLSGCHRDKAFVLTTGNAPDARADKAEETLEEPPEAAWDPGSAGVIYVHVCGAVNEPCVVELPVGSRGEDAVLAAGGFRADAALEAVNLAGKLEDGMQLYIPTMEEAQTARESRQEAEGALVDINRADAARLCTLPGIGEARAAAIIAYREANGLFGRPEDIMQVPGIKESAYEKIKDKITV